MDYEPPISPHEFEDRFYGRAGIRSCLEGHPCNTERDAVDRIPQRKESLDSHERQRYEFWGLIAREKKSALRLVIYVFFSSVPGLIFFFLWLFQWHHENLQDASVLLMISFTLLGLVYAGQIIS